MHPALLNVVRPVKRKKIMVQVLYHGKSHLGIDSDEQAGIQAVLGDDLDISFLPSVQLEKRGLVIHHHAFTTATVIIIVGILSYYFIKGFAQGLGDEIGKGVGKALKTLGQKLWQGRRSKTYSLSCKLVYVFTYKGVDCGLRISIPPNQSPKDVSKALDEAFSQASERLKELMHFIDQNLDAARQTKDDLMPLVGTTTIRDKKGQIDWSVYAESKRQVFYSGLDLI